MKQNWIPKADDIETEKSYEKKMHDAFMAHIGKRYEEQLLEESTESMENIRAPKSLDDWFFEFCREKWGTEDMAVWEEEEEKMEIAEQETAKKLAVGQNQENDKEYFMLLMYAEQMRLKLKKQQERQRKVRKAAAFAVLFLGVVALTTGTANAFGVNPWKLLIKDEGTNVIISPSDLEDERNYYLSSNWLGYYYPAYVPAGYELKEENVQKLTGKLIFTNETDEIRFYCSYHDMLATLDKEQEEYEVIQIGGQIGYLVLNKEQSIACIYLDRYTIFVLYNDAPTQEIYEMIKKIKKFE